MAFLDVLTQPLLAIPAPVQGAAWQNPSPAWWTTYLNQVCWQTMRPWLQVNDDAIVECEADPETRWQFVNGTALTTSHHRIIVIPDKTINTREFRVPQEWVDLPSWVGDYYVAAQVNPDDASILIWGFTTHHQLKTQGAYDERDRTYCLDAHAMIRDFAVLSVTREVCSEAVPHAVIAPLPNLSAPQADFLLQRLANPDILQPRLALPFYLWGALIENSEWRNQLGQLRSPQNSVVTHLSQWLRNRQNRMPFYLSVPL